MRVYFLKYAKRVFGVYFSTKQITVYPSCIIIFMKLIAFTLLLDVWLSFSPLGSSFIP